MKVKLNISLSLALFESFVSISVCLGAGVDSKKVIRE